MLRRFLELISTQLTSSNDSEDSFVATDNLPIDNTYSTKSSSKSRRTKTLRQVLCLSTKKFSSLNSSQSQELEICTPKEDQECLDLSYKMSSRDVGSFSRLNSHAIAANEILSESNRVTIISLKRSTDYSDHREHNRLSRSKKDKLPSLIANNSKFAPISSTLVEIVPSTPHSAKYLKQPKPSIIV